MFSLFISELRNLLAYRMNGTKKWFSERSIYFNAFGVVTKMYVMQVEECNDEMVYIHRDNKTHLEQIN